MTTPTPVPPLPAPLQITADLLAPASSIVIPLHAVPLPVVSAAPQDYKLGILVQATDAQGRQSEPRLFEFDTGGQGFWMQPSGQIPTPPLADCSLQISYTSGISYSAQAQPLTLTFPGASAPLSVPVTVGVIGQIQNATFPIFGAFYGDFGATLQAWTDASTSSSLLTALAQLPAPYNSGFIVDVGGYPPGSASPGSPRLIVGLTDALRALFPCVVPMTPAPDYRGSDGPVKTFQETLIDAVLTVNGASTQPIGVVFDTGAPSTRVHLGDVVPANFTPEPGDNVVLVPIDIAGATQFSLLNFTVGNTPNNAGSTNKGALGIAAGYINTGLNPFYRYPIMFDLTAGLIRFPAPPPPPSKS